MSEILISQKLNNIVASFSCDAISFYEGEFNAIKNVLDTICPFSKIAIVYSLDGFSKYSIFSERLKSFGFKVTNIIENDKIVSVEKAGELFSLSENIRCVVAIGSSIFSLVTYYSSMRKIPALYFINDFDFLGALETRVAVFNGKKRDYVYTSLKRHIVLDIDSICKDEKNISKAYSYLMCGLVSMIDYRIAGYIGNNELDSKLYSVFKLATLDGYNVFKYPYKKQSEVLLCSYLTVLILNIIGKGSFIDNSSCKIASLLYGEENIMYCPELIKRILGLCKLSFSKKYNNALPMRDYLADQLLLKELINVDGKALANHIIKNRAIYLENKDGFDELTDKLKDEVNILNNVSSVIENTFSALGGSQNYDSERLNEAISLCGSFPNSFNSITIVKESGILN